MGLAKVVADAVTGGKIREISVDDDTLRVDRDIIPECGVGMGSSGIDQGSRGEIAGRNIQVQPPSSGNLSLIVLVADQTEGCRCMRIIE